MEECGSRNPCGEDWDMWSKLNIYMDSHIVGSHTQSMLINCIVWREVIYTIACYIVHSSFPNKFY